MFLSKQTDLSVEHESTPDRSLGDPVPGVEAGRVEKQRKSKCCDAVSARSSLHRVRPFPRYRLMLLSPWQTSIDVKRHRRRRRHRRCLLLRRSFCVSVQNTLEAPRIATGRIES